MLKTKSEEGGFEEPLRRLKTSIEDVTVFLGSIGERFGQAAQKVYGRRVYENNCYGYHKALSIVLSRKFPDSEFELLEGENSGERGDDQRWVKATLPKGEKLIIEGTKMEGPISVMPYVKESFDILGIKWGFEFDPDAQGIKYDHSRIDEVLREYRRLSDFGK
jgi:hypothetical protein